MLNRSMLNIVVPMAGNSLFFEEHELKFPKPLLEIKKKMMIQHVLDYLSTLEREHRYVFIINQSDAQQFHLDNVIRLLTNEDSVIIEQRGNTKGAVCSILLAIESINNDLPLIISNADQIIDRKLADVIKYFEEKNADAGAICFESVHPQWSYLLLDETSGKVVEAAEKRPISKNAIAGFYYFKRGRDFVEAAKRTIKKDVSVKDRYFTSLTFNELILEGKNVYPFLIKSEEYHSFYSPEKIQEFIQG